MRGCVCVCACICVCNDTCLLCYLICGGLDICVIISTLPDNRKLFDRGFWQIHFFKLGVQADIIVYIYLHINTCIHIYTHMGKQKFCVVQNMSWKIWSFDPSASIFAPSYQRHMIQIPHVWLWMRNTYVYTHAGCTQGTKILVKSSITSICTCLENSAVSSSIHIYAYIYVNTTIYIATYTVLSDKPSAISPADSASMAVHAGTSTHTQTTHCIFI